MKFLTFIRDNARWLLSMGLVLLAVSSFRSAIADWNDVPTGSMLPTIQIGDRILVNKLAYDLKVPFTQKRIATWDDPARGDIVDEEALVEALASRHLSGAGLDVFEKEPAVNPRLLGLPNVVLLPHMGSATVEGRLEMGEKVIINIKTFEDGHRPPDLVVPAML